MIKQLIGAILEIVCALERINLNLAAIDETLCRIDRDLREPKEAMDEVK